MKLNDSSQPKIRFTFRDRITCQSYGGELNFYGLEYENFPIIHFECEDELRNAIKLLTDMYDMAMNDREYLGRGAR